MSTLSRITTSLLAISSAAGFLGPRLQPHPLSKLQNQRDGYLPKPEGNLPDPSNQFNISKTSDIPYKQPNNTTSGNGIPPWVEFKTRLASSDRPGHSSENNAKKPDEETPLIPEWVFTKPDEK